MIDRATVDYLCGIDKYSDLARRIRNLRPYPYLSRYRVAAEEKLDTLLRDVRPAAEPVVASYRLKWSSQGGFGILVASAITNAMSRSGYDTSQILDVLTCRCPPEMVKWSYQYKSSYTVDDENTVSSVAVGLLRAYPDDFGIGTGVPVWAEAPRDVRFQTVNVFICKKDATKREDLLLVNSWRPSCPCSSLHYSGSMEDSKFLTGPELAEKPSKAYALVGLS